MARTGAMWKVEERQASLGKVGKRQVSQGAAVSARRGRLGLERCGTLRTAKDRCARAA
jgi:hypothetical protein